MMWHSNTYRLEGNYDYGMERIWSIGILPGLSCSDGREEGEE